MFSLRRKIINFTNQFRSHALVLMYHRVADTETDFWELAVSPENFERQLQVLQHTNKVVPLSQIVDQVQKKRIVNRSIAVTFDDGYVDNYVTAKPLLERYGIPATFFITNKNTGRNKEFWWDELERIVFQSNTLPQTISLNTQKEKFFFNLHEETNLTEALRTKHRSTVAFGPGTLRSKLYFHLWEFLSPMLYSEQQNALKEIRSWAGINESIRPHYCCMTSDQIKDISLNTLFEIGAHTASHPDLSYHPKEFQQKEILENLVFLKNLTSKRIQTMAYPSGKFNDATIEVVKHMGFNAAFSTNANTITKSSELYRIGRYQVKNWTKDTFTNMLSAWLHMKN